MKLFGDIPIYVARDGADEAAHPELFQHGLVAGAPPDGLSAVGQLWGNPLYDWGAMRAQGYRWWIERLRRTFELYDAARVDHFRGFVCVLGGARSDTRRRSAATGCAGRAPSSSTRPSASSGRSASSPRISA